MIGAMFLAAMAVAASPAQDPRGEAPDAVVVRYGDLDLSTPAGQDALALRIDRAVWRQCRSAHRLSLTEARACRIEVRAAIHAHAQGEARAALDAIAAREAAEAQQHAAR